MLKFFKPDDFHSCPHLKPLAIPERVASIANAKLSNRIEELCRPLIGIRPESSETILEYVLSKIDEAPCEHRLEQIKALPCKGDYNSYRFVFACECGTPMKPSAFEKVKLESPEFAKQNASQGP